MKALYGVLACSVASTVSPAGSSKGTSQELVSLDDRKRLGEAHEACPKRFSAVKAIKDTDERRIVLLLWPKKPERSVREKLLRSGCYEEDRVEVKREIAELTLLLMVLQRKYNCCFSFKFATRQRNY